MTQLITEKALCQSSSKLYHKIADDNETLKIYGLNHGDTDEIGESLNYESSTVWFNPDRLSQDLINSLYQNNPDENQFWPIWQTFIDSSNKLTN